MSTITERVQRGHQWLRENRPYQIAYINLRTLNVANARLCPLGQTGGFLAAYTQHGMGTSWAAEHGFAGATFTEAESHALTEAWIKELS